MTLSMRFELDAARAADALQRLGKTIQEVMGKSAYGLALEVKREAVRNLRGEVMRSRGTINDLRVYISGLAPEKESDGVSWGLPTGGEMESGAPTRPRLPMSRIGKFFEEGGTIRPVNAKMLRIPIPNGPAVTAAGYDRFAGIPLRTTSNQGWRVGKKADGRLFLLRPTTPTKGPGAGKTRAEVWYRLMDQTTIRPHPWFSFAVEKVQGRMDNTVAEAMREAGLE